MAPEPQILYLEPDDEITSVVRRLRESDASRLVLVAPGRSKATSSVVALRLLAEVAAEDGREVALVADPLARTLAGEAGIPAFATVGEATSGSAPAVEAAPARRAAIHVVRPEPPADRRSRPSDETRAVPVARPRPPTESRPRAASDVRPRPAPVRRPPAKRRSMVPLVGVAVLIAALLAAGGLAAAVLPAATIRITPIAKRVGPLRYAVTSAAQDRVSGEVQATLSGKATGDHVEVTKASGTVVFQSGNPGRCRVPQGTRVSAATVVFATVEDVVVPEGKFTGRGITPGAASVGVVALEAGPAGNVAADAIDTILDDGLTFCLRGFPNTTHRIVDNPKATTGGDETHTPEVVEKDVDALRDELVAKLRSDLDAQLAAHKDVLMAAPAEPEQPAIEVPKDLVGTRGKESFELSGTLAYDRPSVRISDVEAAAREKLLNDGAAVPAGAVLDPDSIDVRRGEVTLDGDRLVVAVTVTAAAIPELDTAALREELKGRTPDEARDLLADVGDVDVELWPGWVSRIPGMDWRVSIDVSASEPGGPVASESP